MASLSSNVTQQFVRNSQATILPELLSRNAISTTLITVLVALVSLFLYVKSLRESVIERVCIDAIVIRLLCPSVTDKPRRMVL